MAEATTNSIRNASWARRVLAVAAVLAVVGVGTGFLMYRAPVDAPVLPTPGGEKPIGPAVGGVPLFHAWPKDGNPALVLALTGQTYGYLSPCGCSRPQKGGLERRANLLDGLRAKGWTVVGLDLGDVSAPKGLPKQNLLKYRTSIAALGAMGYAAVGLGEYDFAGHLFGLLGEYANMPGAKPIILASNLVGTVRGPDGKPSTVIKREDQFPPDTKGGRPMVEGVEVIAMKDKPAIAVVGLIGPDVGAKMEKLDSTNGYADSTWAIKEAFKTAAEHPAKPGLFVLLYAGNLDRAKKLAETFPQFQLIVCQSEDSEPPQFPTAANGGKTMIVQVGHKGQNVGLVGVFPDGKGAFDLNYQLVPLGEEYLTPANPDKVRTHKVLNLLEKYAADVEKNDLLAAARAKPLQHPTQIAHQAAAPTYVGAAECAKCHAAEFQVWKNSKHSHAYAALVQLAERPAKRQFDPECVICHTTGFEYVGGFENATKTPFLEGNQCENCHGPGSAHAKAPNDKTFYPDLMRWRGNGNDKLPDLATLTAIAKTSKPDRHGPNSPLSKLPANQQQAINAVSGMCMKCHDSENDPKFDFFEYFPKIQHSGLKQAGLPPGIK